MIDQPVYNNNKNNNNNNNNNNNDINNDSNNDNNNPSVAGVEMKINLINCNLN